MENRLEGLKNFLASACLFLAVIGMGYVTYTKFKKSPHLVPNYIFNKFVEVEGKQVVITNFSCGVGRVGLNQIDGDFETLNNEVYSSLKGESGIYAVFLVYTNVKDSYGNDITRRSPCESVNADQLNLYKDVTYWVRSTGGMSRIIFPSN